MKRKAAHEPFGAAFAKLGAVPFGLLEGTAGLELVAALQHRDADGWYALNAEVLRRIYREFRRNGVSMVVEVLRSTDILKRASVSAYAP